jgi:hypothetical protein
MHRVFVTGGTGYIGARLMVAALVHAVENPASGVRIVDVPGIRAARG